MHLIEIIQLFGKSNIKNLKFVYAVSRNEIHNNFTILDFNQTYLHQLFCIYSYLQDILKLLNKYFQGIFYSKSNFLTQESRRFYANKYN